MSRGVRIGALFAALVVALPLGLWASVLAWGHTLGGLRIDGVPLPPSAAPGPAIEARAARWLAAPVHVDADGTVRTRTRGELGTTLDAAAMTRRARSIGRAGRPLEDLGALFRTWSGGTDLSWAPRVDREALARFVEELANEVDRPARPAELDGRGRLVELSANGARLDRRGSIAALRDALTRGRRTVTLPVDEISSGVGDSALPPVVLVEARPVSIGHYSTRFATHGAERPRAHNVITAASYLDGAVIPPLGRLSFNDQVGDRSTARGYRIAHVISDGEMVDGLGGGVCQVASTLHAAAFLAGLEIVEHVPHSRPSAYIPMGLDATVVWPNVDLVIANPFPFAILVRARADGGRMVVELLGRERVRRVDWSRRTLETEEWSDRYVEDPEVPPGEERVTQSGIRGFLILRERTLQDGRGVRLEETRLRYPPTDRIIRVAPDTLDPFTGLPRSSGAPAAPPPNPF